MYFGFKNITIKYGDNEVLKDVTIDFPKGKTSTIIGANGCGKSSLLKIVSRAVKPTTGEVIFCGKPLKSYNTKDLAKKIAYLPQIHTSPEDIDVKTLVSYGRFPYKKWGRGLTQEDIKIIDETIALTGLKSIEDRMLNNLSGGERQRAWIAMTICQQPEIIILDEPITYLDVGYQLEVMEMVKEMGEKLKITIIMVLHDINLAARYSHNILAIKGKQVLKSGTPRSMITKETMKKVYNIGSQICEDEINGCPFMIPEKEIN